MQDDRGSLDIEAAPSPLPIVAGKLQDWNRFRLVLGSHYDQWDGVTRNTCWDGPSFMNGELWCARIGALAHYC
jgi:hypothetical protein